MDLDTTTLRVAFALMALTLFVLFYFIAYRRTRSPFSGWWSAALLFFLGGSCAYLLDGTSHQAWANPLGNTLLVVGAVSVWAGARSLRTARAKPWQLAAPPTATGVASLLDNPAINDWSGGQVFLAFMCVMIALASRELWRLPPGYSRVDRPMAIASGILAAYYLGRWIAFLAQGPDGPVFERYFGTVPTTLLTMVLLTVVSFSMAALSNEQQTRDLRARASQDGLTGLLNRTGFAELAADRLRRLASTGTRSCLVLADLDHFKSVNDTYGHGAGDRVLQAFSAACTGTVRATDLVGRYGGEEFILLLPGADPDGAAAIAGEISRRLQESAPAAGHRLPTVSYGIAPVQPGATELEPLIAAADAALYRAKSLGRNRAVHAPDAPRPRAARGADWPRRRNPPPAPDGNPSRT